MSHSIEAALIQAAQRGVEANVETSGKNRYSVWVHNHDTDSTVMHDVKNLKDVPGLIDAAVAFLRPEKPEVLAEGS